MSSQGGLERASIAVLLGVLAWSGAWAVPPRSLSVAGAEGIAGRPSAAVVETVVVRTERELTVSWSARSRVPVGRFRLYRLSTGSDLLLVGEADVLVGEHTYRLEDLPETSGTVVYHLRYSTDTGHEATLGTLLCLEPGLESGSTATTSAPDLWALVPMARSVAHGGSFALTMPPGRLPCGWKPEPESPPPRPPSV